MKITEAQIRRIIREEIKTAYDQNPELLDEAFFDNISKGIKNFMGRFKKPAEEPIAAKKAAGGDSPSVGVVNPENERRINLSPEARVRVESKIQELSAYLRKLSNLKEKGLQFAYGAGVNKDKDFNKYMLSSVNLLKETLKSFEELPEISENTSRSMQSIRLSKN